MKREYMALLGYILLAMGFVALILGMIGLQLTPLAFLESTLGPLGAFITKICMVVVGIVLFYVSRLPEED